MPMSPCLHVTVTPLVVRPGDMDMDRNGNNAVYFEYLYQSRLEHLIHLGVYHPRSHSANLFALAENTCRYLAPPTMGMCCSSGQRPTPSGAAASSWYTKCGGRTTKC